MRSPFPPISSIIALDPLGSSGWSYMRSPEDFPSVALMDGLMKNPVRNEVAEGLKGGSVNGTSVGSPKDIQSVAVMDNLMMNRPGSEVAEGVKGGGGSGELVGSGVRPMMSVAGPAAGSVRPVGSAVIPVGGARAEEVRRGVTGLRMGRRVVRLPEPDNWFAPFLRHFAVRFSRGTRDGGPLAIFLLHAWLFERRATSEQDRLRRVFILGVAFFGEGEEGIVAASGSRIQRATSRSLTWQRQSWSMLDFENVPRLAVDGAISSRMARAGAIGTEWRFYRGSMLRAGQIASEAIRNDLEIPERVATE
jgi:hypothetical protein